MNMGVILSAANMADSVKEFFGSEWFERNGRSVLDSTLDWLARAGVNIVLALLIMLGGWWAAAIVGGLIKKITDRSKLDKGASGFICSCVKTVIKLVAVVAAIARLGVNITSIITALGAAGITIGLAMKDSLSNIASGVLILFNHPFRVGDFIEVGGVTGTVKTIELTYSVLLSPDNKELIFPNSKLVDDSIINYTGQKLRRLDMTFPAPYDSDPEKVKELLRDCCAHCGFIDQTQPVTVGIRTFGDSSIMYEVRAWIDCSTYWESYFDMQERVLAAFKENSLEIPYNQLDVHVKQQ